MGQIVNYKLVDIRKAPSYPFPSLTIWKVRFQLIRNDLTVSNNFEFRLFKLAPFVWWPDPVTISKYSFAWARICVNSALFIPLLLELDSTEVSKSREELNEGQKAGRSSNSNSEASAAWSPCKSAWPLISCCAVFRRLNIACAAYPYIKRVNTGKVRLHHDDKYTVIVIQNEI